MSNITEVSSMDDLLFIHATWRHKKQAPKYFVYTVKNAILNYNPWYIYIIYNICVVLSLPNFIGLGLTTKLNFWLG